jgi:hypothetical protein
MESARRSLHGKEPGMPARANSKQCAGTLAQNGDKKMIATQGEKETRIRYRSGGIDVKEINGAHRSASKRRR